MSVPRMSVAEKSSILPRLSFHRAGARDLPHSRHEVLDRDVINPQKGHILCDAKPGAAGVIAANSFETEAVMEATRLRRRSRNRRRARSISDPPSFFLPCKGPAFGASGRSALEDVFPQDLFLISANLTMTRQCSLFCARLLTLHESIGAQHFGGWPVLSRSEGRGRSAGSPSG